MPLPKSKTSATDALVGLWTIGLSAFVICILYFGRELLTPLALAALLTFLLSPLVTRLQKWLGRIGAVLLVVVLMFAATICSGWVLTRQIVDLGSQLPNYKENIRTKVKSIQLPSGGAFTRLSDTFDELKKDLPGANGVIRQQSAEGVQKLEPREDGEAIAVKVVSSPDPSPLQLFRMIVAPIVGPLGTTALVLLLVIFMLLKREDLRGRLIRLIGQGRISATTSAMDDAASRVSRYLLMQLVVNVTYGMAAGLGLWLIGVPNAVLWGTFAAVLRFIPYVGPWIAAAFPIILSLAVSSSWSTPLMAIGLFVVLELLSNNVMEPWLYGSSTGVSSLALIVAAVFWTYIWGPVGLVMATPITVCLAVMGRHIPKLQFLNVILSDEEALTPAEDCYHRLLRAGGEDELELAEAYLKTHTLSDFYDSMLVPALITGGKDHNLGLLDRDQIDQLEHAVVELIDELEERLPAIAKISESENHVPIAPYTIYCVPAKAERDRLTGEMLAQLLRKQGAKVSNAPSRLTAAERSELASKADADLVCISVTEPSTVSHARYLCLKFRAVLAPGTKIMVGLWGTTTLSQESEKILLEAGADLVVKNIADAYLTIRKLSISTPPKMMPAPIPEQDEERVKSLESTGILDASTNFRPFTDKLSRIFEAPIAMLSLVDRKFQHFKAETGLPEPLASAGKSPRDISFCGHVVAIDEMIVVEDLSRDRRFSDNPLVKDYDFRFYAGAPVHAPDGSAIGTLCVIDTVPRDFTEREKRLLNEYAADISNEISRATDNIG